MLMQMAIPSAAGGTPAAGPARLRVLPGGSGRAPDERWSAQFGPALARAGVAALPGALYQRQAELGLSAQEVWFISAALAQKWSRGDPCPSLKQLAAASGVDAKWLKELRARLVARGLLQVATRFAASGAQLANSYDFGPLLARLAAPPAGEPDTPEAGDPRDGDPAAYSFAARYGAAIARAGVISAPMALFRFQRALGLTPQQVWFICYILAFQWGPALPYPSLKKMAARTGYSERHIHTLKQSLVDAGYLRLVTRRAPGGGQDNNAYDLRPLFAALASQVEQDGGAAADAIALDGGAAADGIAPDAATPGAAAAVDGAPVAPIPGARAPRRAQTRRCDNPPPAGAAPPGGGATVPLRGAGDAAGGRGPGAAGRGVYGATRQGVYGAANVESRQVESNQPGDSNRRETEFSEAGTGAAPPPSAYIAGVILDYGREFGDAAHAASNVTRALRLWQSSGLPEAAFVLTLHEARRTVRLYQGRQGFATIANRMAYFFRVAEDRLRGENGAPAWAAPA